MLDTDMATEVMNDCGVESYVLYTVQEYGKGVSKHSNQIC